MQVARWGVVRRLFRDLPRDIAVLACVAFAVAVGFGVVAPALPVFAREFGVGRTAAGAVISMFAFMRLISAFGGGRLVDRFGERRVLAAGIAIVAVSSALTGLSQSYLQLLGLRAFGGIGSAMFTVAAVSLVLRTAPAHLRGRATGLFQSGFLIGGIAGPGIGGLLADVSLRAPFFLYAGTLAVAGTIGLFLLSGEAAQSPDTGAGPPQRTGLRTALRNPAYRTALVANFGSGWTLFGVRSSLIPLFVLEGMHRGTVWVGAGFVVSSAAQAALLLPAGRLADTAGRRPALLLGGGLAAGSMLLIAVSSSLAAYLVAMLAFGVGSAFLGVAPGAIVGDVVVGRGGTVVAVFQMAADLGAVVGPLLAGQLADRYSFAAAFGATAGVLTLGVLMALAMPESRVRQP